MPHSGLRSWTKTSPTGSTTIPLPSSGSGDLLFAFLVTARFGGFGGVAVNPGAWTSLGVVNVNAGLDYTGTYLSQRVYALSGLPSINRSVSANVRLMGFVAWGDSSDYPDGVSSVPASTVGGAVTFTNPPSSALAMTLLPEDTYSTVNLTLTNSGAFTNSKSVHNPGGLGSGEAIAYHPAGTTAHFSPSNSLTVLAFSNAVLPSPGLSGRVWSVGEDRIEFSENIFEG